MRASSQAPTSGYDAKACLDGHTNLEVVKTESDLGIRHLEGKRTLD